MGQEIYLCTRLLPEVMELHYRTEGDTRNPVFMILHGLYGMSDNWVSLARRYAAAFYVIMPDLRNHGLSPHHPLHTYEAMAGDVEELIQRLQCTELNLMGHSMGGKVAMLLALRHPGIVRRLIIADIGPGPTPGAALHQKIGEALISLQPREFSSRTEISHALQQKIGNPAIVQLMLKNIGKDAEGHFYWKPNLSAILQYLDNIAGPIKIQGYYSNPTLLIKGEKSDYVKDEDVEWLLRHFLLLREEVIAGAGHWLHADNPEAFFKITFDFLTQT